MSEEKTLISIKKSSHERTFHLYLLKRLKQVIHCSKFLNKYKLINKELHIR